MHYNTSLIDDVGLETSFPLDSHCHSFVGCLINTVLIVVDIVGYIVKCLVT